MPSLLFVQSDTFSFVRYQMPLVEAALNAGWQVHCALPADEERKALPAIDGVQLHDLSIPRGIGGVGPNLQAVRDLRYLRRHLAPHVVLHVGLKSVFIGGIAGAALRGSAVMNRLLGLGYSFTSNETKAQLIRLGLRAALGSMLKGVNRATVFENGDDLRTLADAGLIDQATAHVLPCGVDTTRYTALTFPMGEPKAVYLGRMLRDKGIPDLVEAARILKAKGRVVTLEIYGAFDEANPSSITRDELAGWEREGLIVFKGFASDIQSIWAKAHIALLPSYREGLPVSILEAAACARAAIVTDVPGCRDAVESGVTGWLVSPGSAQAIADALEDAFFGGADLEKMGQAARQRVERKFDSSLLANELMGVIASMAPIKTPSTV